MKKSVKNMQGTSAFIETHYEAISYYPQAKKICFFCKNRVCTNVNSKQFEKNCIGYTKCSDFISEERIKEKQIKQAKIKNKRKQHIYSTNELDEICKKLKKK